MAVKTKPRSRTVSIFQLTVLERLSNHKELAKRDFEKSLDMDGNTKTLITMFNRDLIDRRAEMGIGAIYWITDFGLEVLAANYHRLQCKPVKNIQ